MAEGANAAVKIENLGTARIPGGARASARVTWEDADRPPLELFFETDGEAAGDLSPEADAFATACMLPAMRDGERRLWIEGAVCPRLASGLTRAVERLCEWYGPPRRPVAVEPSRGFRESAPRRPARASFFFTGGIDSLDMLRRNRRAHPLGHPESFAEGLSLFGHLCKTDERTASWNRGVFHTLSNIGERLSFRLTPVRTNLWELAPQVEFLAAESLASALLSAAHLFPARWSSIAIASGRDFAREHHRGTHPSLDPLYGSAALEVRRFNSDFTRLQRLRAVAEDASLLENLIVCLAFPTAPRINCGECEKCVRTMSSLLAIGKLDLARRFPSAEVTAEMIRAVTLGEFDVDYWTDFLPLLAASGRTDLSDAIAEKLEETRRFVRWSSDAGWRGGLRKLDRRYLGGRLLKMRQRLRA
jgi:hypothetical protein